jgi:hypothetical protein
MPTGSAIFDSINFAETGIDSAVVTSLFVEIEGK